MKTSITFGRQGMNESTDEYLRRCLKLIEEAAQEDAFVIADAFTVSNFTTSRTLNAGTATTAQLANFVATFISDLQKRSINRAE